MSIVVRYKPMSLTKAQYDKVNELMLEQSGNSEPVLAEGLAVHVLFGDEGNLMVSEIWDSEEQQQAFRDEALIPALQAAGVEVDPAGPDIFQVHNLLERSAAPAA